LLYGVKFNEATFKKMLGALQIDSRNYVSFQTLQIYSYATHYKKFYFTFFQNAFILSEEMELVKRSVMQFRNPINLLMNNEFSQLHQLVEKNMKQNWVLLHHPYFFNKFEASTDAPQWAKFETFTHLSEWSAFQMRIGDNELHFTGYCTATAPLFEYFSSQQDMETDVAPFLPAGSHQVSSLFTSHPTDSIASIFVSASSQMLYQQTRPNAICHFKCQNGNTTYRYVLLLTDSTRMPADHFTNDTLADILYKKFTLYPTGWALQQQKNHQDSAYSWMTEWKSLSIFADSQEALNFYIDKAIGEQTLAQNSFYRYAKGQIPSQRCFDYFMTNPDGKYPFKLLSFSMQTPKSGFVPITLFCQF
jgi:hypothetical protein